MSQNGVTMDKYYWADMIRVNTPLGGVLALISAIELNNWLKVCLTLTAIVLSILTYLDARDKRKGS